MSNQFQGTQPNRSPDDPLDIKEFTYSATLLTIGEEFRKGTPENISGYTQVKNCPFVSVDLLTVAFVAGADTLAQLEEQLVAKFGDDYSLRCTIVNLTDPKTASRSGD